MTPESSTRPDMVSAAEPPQLQRRRSTVTIVVALTVAVMLVAASTVKVSYFTQAPGSAVALGHLISVEGADVFESEGEIFFTTVRLTGEISVLEYVLALADSSVELRTSDEVLRGQTRDQQRQQNLQLMDDSQDIATRVALDRLGHDVIVEAGALIQEVLVGSGSDGRLEPGDIVLEAEGQSILSSPELVDVIQALRPGDTIHLVVERTAAMGDSEIRDVEIVLGESEGRPQMGVAVSTWLDLVDLPFDVGIDTASVGGPSAGFALTLAILDLLTEGELTGGGDIATTGTIDVFGNIGPIGGAEQKAHAVRRAGIDLFLVPTVNFQEALDGAGDDLEVVAVDTLEDALDILLERGGNATGLDLPRAAA